MRGSHKEHESFVIQEKVIRVLHLVLSRDLRGCAQSALLWRKLFVDAPLGIVFTLNPCDLYVANADADIIQYAILQHADDNKISHKSMKTVKSIVSKLEDRSVAIFSKCFGPECDFLRMKIVLKSKKGSTDMRESV